MIYIEFVNLEAARRYVPDAGTPKQSFANTYVQMGRERVGRHEYVRLYNRVSRKTTRVYVPHIKHMRTQR